MATPTAQTGTSPMSSTAVSLARERQQERCETLEKLAQKLGALILNLIVSGLKTKTLSVLAGRVVYLSS